MLYEENNCSTKMVKAFSTIIVFMLRLLGVVFWNEKLVVLVYLQQVHSLTLTVSVEFWSILLGSRKQLLTSWGRRKNHQCSLKYAPKSHLWDDLIWFYYQGLFFDWYIIPKSSWKGGASLEKEDDAWIMFWSYLKSTFNKTKIFFFTDRWTSFENKVNFVITK